MAEEKIETNRNYEEIDRPYDSSLSRSEYAPDNGNLETQPVKSDGGMGDIWIKNYIRSENWKPKSVGFYINGLTGYAEFSNVFVTGNINAVTGSIGGFEIGSDYIRDSIDSFGLASTVAIGDDVRFWAGETFKNRATAIFRIHESGAMVASSATITGEVNATSGTFSGAITVTGSITGGLIRTSAGSNRVELNGTDNALYLYSGNVKRIAINSIGMKVYNGSGDQTGQIYSVSLVANEITLDNVFSTVSLIGTSAAGGANYFSPGLPGDGTINLGSSDSRWLNVSAIRYYVGGAPFGDVVHWEAGVGTPENSITANPGSLYSDTTGGAGATLYVKETGTGDTGWVVK